MEKLIATKVVNHAMYVGSIQLVVKMSNRGTFWSMIRHDIDGNVVGSVHCGSEKYIRKMFKNCKN